MTVPFPAAQPGQRGANGYMQMPGGYDAAVAAARGQPAPPQAPQQPQTILGQPAAQAPFFPQVQEQGWQPPPAANDPRFAAARQPQAQPQFQQPAAQPQADPMTYRLNDPRVPAHLQGRSIAEIVNIAEGLRNVHLQSLSQPAVQPVQPAQPTQSVQQPAAPGEFDWRKPRESIAAIMRETLQTDLLPLIQPALQQVQGNGIVQARNTVAAEMGDVFASIEPIIMEDLKGITDPRLLTNPQTWRFIAQQAIGKLWMRSRQGGGQPPVGQPAPQQQPQNPWMQPQAAAGAPQQPIPNLNGFYSEQPNQGGPVSSAVTLTPAMDAARQAMGMSREDYIAWGGGVRAGGAA